MTAPKKSLPPSEQAGTHNTDFLTKEQHQPSKRKRRVLYAEITIAAWTGSISATHLFDPTSPDSRGSTSGIWSLERALTDLAQGGYVIDLRPLAEHPKLSSWVFQAPIPNGQLQGDEIERLPESVRASARDMAPWLEGEYQWLASVAANRVGEPVNASVAGPFDYVSAAYLATYWKTRGALVGMRQGQTLYWSDGREQAIDTPEKPVSTASPS